jgi:hypothetical protein
MGGGLSTQNDGDFNHFGSPGIARPLFYDCVYILVAFPFEGRYTKDIFFESLCAYYAQLIGGAS